MPIGLTRLGSLHSAFLSSWNSSLLFSLLVAAAEVDRGSGVALNWVKIRA